MRKRLAKSAEWMAKPQGKDMTIVAKRFNFDSQEHLLVDITKEVPIVRIVLSENGFANFFPDESPVKPLNKSWNTVQIHNLELPRKLLKYEKEKHPEKDGEHRSCCNPCYQVTGYKSTYKEFISEESKDIIASFTGLDRTTAWKYAISFYQGDIQRNKRDRQEELRREKIDRAMSMVPETPEGFFLWASAHVDVSYMFFLPFRKRKETTGICSSCGKRIKYLRGEIKPGKILECGYCGKKVISKRLDWEDRNPLPVFGHKESVLLFQRAGESFIQRHFIIYKDIGVGNESYELVETGRKIITNGKYEVYFHKQGWGMTFWDDRNLYGMNNIRLENGPVFPNITEEMFMDSEYRYCAMEFMNYEKGLVPIRWLHRYREIRQIEIMAKIGLRRLALEISPYDYKEGAKPWECMGISKIQLNRLRAINGGLRAMRWMRYEKEKKRVCPDGTIQFFEENNIDPSDIQFIADRMSNVQIANYLEKQTEERGKAKETLETWADYIVMAERLQMPVDQELFYKPKNLRKSHDDAVKLSGGEGVTKRVNEILRKFPDVDKICGSIQEKYSYSDKKYAIVVPERIEEIIVEGRKLGHCLDGSDRYFERIQNKESFIVFLRKSEDIEKPYYTLEIEPDGTTRQKRTVGDKQNADIKDAEAFIRRWQKALQKRLTTEDYHLQDASAELRKKEFEELRQTRAKVWHGALAGKLLVDVLEADLMEASVRKGVMRA